MEFARKDTTKGVPVINNGSDEVAVAEIKLEFSRKDTSQDAGRLVSEKKRSS